MGSVVLSTPESQSGKPVAIPRSIDLLFDPCRLGRQVKEFAR
jgi:hypothetical protein